MTDLTDRSKAPSAQQSLFRLQSPNPACRYTSLVLTQTPLDGGDNGQTQWEVTGFPNEADRQAHRLTNALSCPLIRLK